MTQAGRALKTAAMCITAAVALSACSTFGRGDDERAEERAQAEQTGGIGVNSFLWRASLDTLNFMPLASADPFGGVIITDWYNDPAVPNERFKATVYILDTRLRADALNVSIFRQQLNPEGVWVDTVVTPETEVQIEDQILRTARQLRLDSLGDSNQSN